MTFNEVIEKLKTENAAAILKHGFWTNNFTNCDQAEAINSEFMEWYTAFIDSNITGEHGEIAELLDLANVCIRRVMYLSGDPHA